MEIRHFFFYCIIYIEELGKFTDRIDKINLYNVASHIHYKKSKEKQRESSLIIPIGEKIFGYFLRAKYTTSFI